MCPAPSHPITRALPDLQAWTAHFLVAPMPVLAETAELLETYRANEDAVDAHLLGETISTDPLMSLKLMAHVAGVRSRRSTTDPETVTAALVLLGISPFFRAFGPQTSVDRHLSGHPEALQGLDEVLKRAHRSAAFALAFAVHRMDHDAPVIHAATLLHDFAEVLLWLHAGRAQRELLNIELPDLQQALMRAWHLPELLVQINDERHAETAQVRNVLLAVRLARHSALGWDNAALDDDVRDIAVLLNLGPAPTLQLLRDIDA
jgi:HD-like signal output (HDOD) protein